MKSVKDVQGCLADIDLLEGQEDKTLLSRLLFKELINSSVQKLPIVCFLMEHFIEKESLINGLWETLKNQNLKSDVKIMILNLLREWDSDWSYSQCEEFLDDADEILDENTKQLLNNAIINPEVQIDFMDFMASIKVEDKITLLQSFGEDFGDDELANILIPVFEAAPNSPEGREALKLLAGTKSQLGLHVLERMGKVTTGELNQAIRKSLATLKMSGVREDNTKEFYKKILSNSKPDKFYLTYPDGHGDMALICTRLTEEDRIRFISIVINLDTGIKDCFGFFDISQFECDKILERFLRDEKVASLSPEAFKTVLYNAELSTIESNSKEWKLPYEYVCWKNLLIDIDETEERIEQIVASQVHVHSITESVFEDLDKMKVSAHWFLDAHYSDEFEQFIKEMKTETNLDSLVEKYSKQIFYDNEKESWIKKLIVSVFIKLSIGKGDDAAEIYSLAKNENLFEQFLINILKRSVYEYLMTVKYNKDLNEENYTEEEISSRIKYIEENWIK